MAVCWPRPHISMEQGREATLERQSQDTLLEDGRVLCEDQEQRRGYLRQDLRGT